MKHYIVMVWLLACSMSAAAQTSHEHSTCEEDSINPMKEAILSEITVSGLTGTERMKDSPIAFTVISPRQLHLGSGTNIVDLIAHEPGLSQISTGAGISKPVIRGLGYNRVVVVEQGIRQEGQQWGDEHGLEVDAEGVHSVEILKGPASLMYGSDAIAGVLVLHPEHPLPLNTMQAKAGGEYQSNNGLYNYHAGFSGNINGWLWNWHYNDKAAHCYKNSHDGYVPGSWYKERDIQGMLGVQKQWGHSWLRFSHVDFTPGITEGERDEDTGELEWEDGNTPKSYSNQLPFQRVIHTKAVTDNAWYLGQGTLKAIMGYQQNYRREFEEATDEAELAMRLHTVNYDIRYQLPMQNQWTLATGINGMWQKNHNEADEMLIPDYNLFDFGYFLTASKQIEHWHLSGGARIDNRHLNTHSAEEDGDTKFLDLRKNFTGITGSIGAVYNINNSTNLRLNVARGFRAPTVSELCSDGVHEGSIQYEMGNAHLKSEYSTQIDLGIDHTSRYISLTASLFCNWIDNYIYLRRLPYETKGYRTYQYQQGDARLLGGEVSIDLHPINPLHILNTLSYVRGIQQHEPSTTVPEAFPSATVPDAFPSATVPEAFPSATVPEASASVSTNSIATEKNLPMMPAPRWTCNVRYEFPTFAHNHCRRTYLGIGMDYTLRQNHFYALDDTETATPSYALFNISAGMDLHVLGHNCIELSVTCQNLFNKAYQSHLSRLKYADEPGIYGMGRNICMKVNIPVDIHL